MNRKFLLGVISLAAPATMSFVSLRLVQPTNEHLSLAAWREDLRYYAQELPKRHKNAFHLTTREAFDAAVKDLDAKLPGMNYDEAAVGFARFQAMIGDAHTNLGIPSDVNRTFPLRLGRFGGDYRVIQVAPGFEKCLGCRVVKVGNTPIREALKRLATLVAQDEYPWFAAAKAEVGLIYANLLHGLRIIPERSAARYTFLDDAGKEFSLDFHEQTLEDQKTTKWAKVFEKSVYMAMAEPNHKVSDKFTYMYLTGQRTVYCRCLQMRDLRGPGAELMDFVKEKKPDKLIIDIRSNPGGSYFEGLYNLINPLEKMPDINRKGHLFVLINALTGSAAMVDSSLFHTKTNALLVGEPIGVKPTEYSEFESFKLPNSGLSLGYSIDFYKFAYDKENMIRPDHEAMTPWEVFKSGHDSAIDWALEYKN